MQTNLHCFQWLLKNPMICHQWYKATLGLDNCKHDCSLRQFCLLRSVIQHSAPCYRLHWNQCLGVRHCVHTEHWWSPCDCLHNQGSCLEIQIMDYWLLSSRLSVEWLFKDLCVAVVAGISTPKLFKCQARAWTCIEVTKNTILTNTSRCLLLVLSGNELLWKSDSSHCWNNVSSLELSLEYETPPDIFTLTPSCLVMISIDCSLISFQGFSHSRDHCSWRWSNEHSSRSYSLCSRVICIPPIHDIRSGPVRWILSGLHMSWVSIGSSTA